MTDQRSRYPVIAVTSSTSTMSLIKILTQVFSQYGLPLKTISDNVLPFAPCELKSHFLKNSIQHQEITPFWPQTNGEIEHFIQPLTKVIPAAYIEGKDWVVALHEFLFSYRVTLHSSTNIPPDNLMFQLHIRYSIPDATNKLNHIDLEEKLEFNDRTKKELATDYATLCRHVMPRSLPVGDRVLVKQQHKNKLSSPFNPYPYCIIPQKSSMFTAKNSETDHEITRNETHFKSIPKQAIAPPVIPDSEGEGEGIARFDGNLEPDLRPVSSPNDHSISLENTSPPRKV